MGDSYGRMDGTDGYEVPGGSEALPPKPEEAPRRRSLLTARVTWRTALAVIVGIVLMRLFVVESVIVDGRSMAKTLLPDEWVLVLKPLKPHRFSVIIFNDPEENVTVVKRVVGMPGDTVSLVPKERERFSVNGSQLVVNDTPVDEPYARTAMPDLEAPVQVPEGSYYVLGDNRDDSVDSREYGTVKSRAVHGIALAVVFPFSQMRIIPHDAEPASYSTGSAGQADQ